MTITAPRVHPPRSSRRRWPAYAATALLLAYAAGKAVFAVQGRLGLPTGPVVSAAKTDAYFLDPSGAQWAAAATGVLGAGLVLATLTPLAHRVPRPLLLVALAGLLLGVGSGASIMIVDGFGGPGPGWQWYHGLVGCVALATLVATAWSAVLRTRPAAQTAVERSTPPAQR